MKTTSKSFNPSLAKPLELPSIHSWPSATHRFDEESVWAVRTALASQRPLLVRGEPGVGKTQLARAAAEVLKVPLLYIVIHARYEAQDLMYQYDAVSRLAQAQVLGASSQAVGWEKELDESRFVRPGVFWWAFDWKTAVKQAKKYCRKCAHPQHSLSSSKWSPGKGSVVLIDEIDKADSDLPNSLLETLGNNGFQIDVTGETVAMATSDQPPLVIITTNEERELPSAFLRRTLVLQMHLAEDDSELTEFLVERGKDHFSKWIDDDRVYHEAAAQLIKDRKNVDLGSASKPGAAEYLDLLRALADLYPNNAKKQQDALKKIHHFAFQKNPKEEMV